MLELKSNSFVSRDKSGKVKHIEQILEPFLSPSFEELSAEQLADQYITEVAPIYEMDLAMITDLDSDSLSGPSEKGIKLQRDKVKETAGSTVVNYQQAYEGVPVWRADFSVHIAQNPMRVTSSYSTLHEKFKLGNDLGKATKDSKDKLTLTNLKKILGLKTGKGVSKINGIRMVIYQFDPEQRIDDGGATEEEKGVAFEEVVYTLPLPKLPQSIKPGTHYAVAEVLFDLADAKWQDVHWLALIEPVTGAVLYLRALVSSISGKVFRMDPISLTGNSSLTPSASQTSLNALRTSVPLTDLVVKSPQDLSGNQVDISEIKTPTAAEPTTGAPYTFNYNVKTTEFSAVNAYYHVNWFFNLMKGMGFNLSTYFDGTTFPVPVDHWGLGGSTTVNAHCPGNSSGNGIGHFCFASAQSGQNVSIADDIRVVIHEFGHALLWDHVSSPNFGFAHSAGDGLGAILMDPTSLAPDRFLTFPWPQSGSGPLDRRHDRSVSAGWGWFGSMYNTGYRGEQVLSTTLFRIYRSVGGDSPHQADREWAARYVAYLIIKAIGTLTTTTNDPEVFVTALMNADLTTSNFEGHPGGALHKVIRWAFEKQGLFQPNAHPGTSTHVTTEGNPPNVDVYIDDGRHGEYPYMYAFWESQDMWVRRNPDGGTTHQEPAVGKTNYMYVKVKNRGSQAAQNTIVKAYHCNPGTGLAWPDHWSPMDTPQLAASGPIAAGGETIIGPFAWKPENYGHECLLAVASATGDLSNVSTVSSPIAHSRFVPFDNNIGQRNVHPVYVLDWSKIPQLIKKFKFEIVNPYNKAVKIELVTSLPKRLRDKKQWILFTNAGGNKFELGPRETRTAILSVAELPRIIRRHPWEVIVNQPLKPGIMLPDEMLDAETEGDELVVDRSEKIRIVTLIDGQNMGGMTYILKPRLRRITRGGFPIGLEEEEIETPESYTSVEGFMDTLRQNPGIKDVKLRKISLDIEFEE
jgi:hypothetical protein